MSQSSSTMKKVSMELGGNAAFIVFDDADIQAAVDGNKKKEKEKEIYERLICISYYCL